MSVAELKAKGNAEFAAKRYDEAIKHYTDAIAAANGEADAPHVLYSNRSACYAGLKQYDQALQDAEKTVELNPKFAKGYGRKGSALHGAHRYEDAVKAFEDGLKVAPEDAGLKKGLEAVQHAMDQEASGPGAGMANMFKDPQLFQKLAANPKTASLVADQAFMQKLQHIQKNPNEAMTAFQDPRMIQVMGVLMGIDMQAFERPEGSSELPADLESKREEIQRQTGGPSTGSSSNGSASTSRAAPQPSTPAPAADEAPAAEEESPEAAEEKRLKAEAEAEKKKGNELYLKRNFEPAIEHYNKAWELHKDITYLNNLGACQFEQGNFDDCIKTCRKAVEEGREMRADYKLVAKAFGRIGSAYAKQGDLTQAIDSYQRSLTEHRTPEILNKLREAERTQKEQQKQAYIDPAKADEERNRGNDLFKSGKFAEAVVAFTEAIKRNPAEPRGYTNRASAYTKLAALPEALKDCEEAIKIDPTFVKAYIRKANVLFGMKEYTKALEAIQRAEDADHAAANGSAAAGTATPNAKEIQQVQYKIQSALYEQRSGETDEETLARAMRDPEVAGIMQDPAMQSLLQQAQQNPQALQDAMKNDVVRGKIQKLVAAGIIKTR